MEIIQNLIHLRKSIAQLRKDNQPIALVPTMGALHEGHLSLIHEAKKLTPHVIVSIFVNPAQFGANEDLESYPKQLKEDTALLKAHEVPIIWAPTVETIYPEGFSTSMQIRDLGENFCGAKRPGHFDGVILIVAKLFNQTSADIAFFGEKDYQQLAIIQQMVLDLDFDINIVGIPTVRNTAGLALSSRNSYLSELELQQATALPHSLQMAAEAIQNGKNVHDILAKTRDIILKSGFQSIDYIDLVDAQSLKKLDNWNGEPARLLVAAFMGKTRLIDNLAIK